jgi:hypothetical protein
MKMEARWVCIYASPLFILSDAASHSVYIASHDCMAVNTEQDMCGRKRYWPALRSHPCT